MNVGGGGNTHAKPTTTTSTVRKQAGSIIFTPRLEEKMAINRGRREEWMNCRELEGHSNFRYLGGGDYVWSSHIAEYGSTG